MEEQTVSYQLAILAKNIGFDQICRKWYRVTSTKPTHTFEPISPANYNDEQTFADVVSAPTQSQLQKYIREKHGLHIVVIPTVTCSWTYKVVRVVSEIDNNVIKGIASVNSLPPYEEVNKYDFNTFEQAISDALQYCCNEIIKNL